MILADVYLGKAFKSGPNRNLIKAPDGYDSVEARESFYVIYNNFHSYPLYLIEYAYKNNYHYNKPDPSAFKKIVEANINFANFRRLNPVEDVMVDADGRQMPDGKEMVKKKKGFFQRIFGKKKEKKV